MSSITNRLNAGLFRSSNSVGLRAGYRVPDLRDPVGATEGEVSLSYNLIRPAEVHSSSGRITLIHVLSKPGTQQVSISRSGCQLSLYISIVSAAPSAIFRLGVCSSWTLSSKST